MTNGIFESFINNDNQNITNKLKNLLYIYKNIKKRIKLIYFLKYKKQIILLKYKHHKYKSFLSKNNVHYRLYNGLKTKQDNIDKLSQKFLLDEANKYTYFPEINHYDLIYQNYYIINNNSPPKEDNNNEKNYRIKTEIPNRFRKYMLYKNPTFSQIKDEEKNNNDLFFKNDYNKNILYNDNNNFRIKNMYYDTIIKKKIALLDKLEKEEQKIKNKRSSRILRYKNTIPNNFNKNIKNIKKDTKNKKSNKSSNRNEAYIKKLRYNNRSQRIKDIDYNLTSYYPSPHISKEIKNNLIIKNFSKKNSGFSNNEKSNNSYYDQSSKNDSSQKNHFFIYNNNENNHFISKSGLPENIDRDNKQKNNKKSNSYRFLPKNECSLILEGNKNRTNKDSKKKNIFNKIIDYNKGKNRISYPGNNRAFNSIGIFDNSLSTNFVDRQSSNDNHTLSLNDNNQLSLIGNKFNKNISYTFPSKNNNSINNNENCNNNIYFKKINNNYRKFGKKNQNRIFNRIMIENNLDNVTSKTINTESSNKNETINNNENYKENLDDFNISIELLDEKKINLSNLKIASGEVNENVNHQRNGQEIKPSMSQKSEPITIQSMSDSKILEIANYYLNDEETVDRIQIDDILSTKNNKTNINFEKNENN